WLITLRCSGCCVDRSLWLAGAPRAQISDDRRNQRGQNHCADHVVKILIDIRNLAAKEISAEDRASHPQQAACDVICQVAAVGHLRSACNRRTEGPHNRHEPRKNHGLATIGFVKLMRALQMAALEDERVLALVERLPGGAADPVAYLV